MDITYHSWQEPRAGEPEPRAIVHALDYYQRPFLLLHEENARSHPQLSAVHPIRNRFWQVVPPGKYMSEESRGFLNSYVTAVEAELAKVISDLSLAYCLHLYRRLAPGPIGRDRQPHTIGLTRAVLEAAIQKYAGFQLCSKIAESATIPIDQVLGGLLMVPEFEIERNIIAQGNQLVLTDFTSADLTTFYDLERLAYEIWKTAAALRTTGKGSPLVVCGPPESFTDGRSLELDFLVTNYDERIGKSGWSYSASGVVFADAWKQLANGNILVPIYNLGGVTSKDFEDFFSKMYGIRLLSEVEFNFVWVPFNLRGYREAHMPFAAAFYRRYGVSLDAVLAVVAALSLRVQHSWIQTHGISFFKYFQRAYEGPCRTEYIHDEILSLLPYACKILGIGKSAVGSDAFQAGVDFWSLDMSNRQNIDLAYSGPHYLFLPIQNDKVFLDYAWILRRLHDLFIGISIPNQNFKGDALESIVRTDKSVLPTKPCKTMSGEKCQIDYATARGSHLVIVECKVVGQSIAFDRGDPQAIKYRTEKVVERGLYEVDKKARWLADHPVGSNYDVSQYSHILPVAVSPFVEFIPSQDSRYWVSKNVPRVLTPIELKNLLDDIPTIASSFNKVLINRNTQKTILGNTKSH